MVEASTRRLTRVAAANRPPPPYPVNSAPSEPSSPSILSKPSRSPTPTAPPPEQHRSPPPPTLSDPHQCPETSNDCQIIIDYSQRVFQTQLQQSQKVEMARNNSERKQGFSNGSNDTNKNRKYYKNCIAYNNNNNNNHQVPILRQPQI
ncbi:uncharacterized protein V6R79_003967 [Siganus canaliculatus]